MVFSASLQPTLHGELHNEFHFAENTDSHGCCCFWKSKSKPHKEYFVDKKFRLVPVEHTKRQKRIIANQRLAEILKHKFDTDPVDNDIAFEMLKERINHDLNSDDPIVDEKLEAIINAIWEIRKGIAIN